jgi:hypothetical protein
VLQKTINKPSPYKRAYVGFAAKWKKAMEPTKKAILQGVKEGHDPQYVINVVFAKYGIHAKFKTLVMDAVVQAMEASGIRLK